MAFKRVLRDLVFIYIAFALIRSGSSNFVIYGALIFLFTFYFYFGPKK